MIVRVGLGIGHRSGIDDGPRFRRLVDALEDNLVDSLWVTERISGDGADPTVAMSMAAARTERLKVGMSVMVLPGRNPVVLAKTMASLDVLSEGRLIPGFGLGARNAVEHQAFGVERSQRASLFDEALPLMRRLWAGEEVTHHGEHFSIEGVTVRPLPHQSHLDVWMGGIAPAELRRVGRLADGWLPSFVTPEDAATGLAEVNVAATAAGRSIDPEHFGVLIPYGSGQLDPALAESIRQRRGDVDPGSMIAASIDAVPELMSQFCAVGFSKFVCVPMNPIGDITQEVERFAQVTRPLETAAGSPSH